MAAYGLYSHIASNKRRSIVLLVGLFFLIYLMVFAGALLGEGYIRSNVPFDAIIALAWRDLIVALPFATIGTILWVLVAYKFHQTLIDAITGGHEVTRQEEPRLYNLLENLCISRGIPMPRLKVMDSDALNAFATGLNEKQYSITVTTGLIKALDNEEIEGVLGHELTHIRNGDVQMMVVAVVIAGVVAFFAELFFRMFFNSGRSYSSGSSSSSSSDKKGGGAGAIMLAIALVGLAWLLSIVVRLALSRSREFLADAGSVELTKNPDAMISALRKIEGRGELPGATSAVMEMCIDNPREGFADILATHPSVDRRAEALVKFAGGHDPGPLMPSADEEEQGAPQPDGQDQLPPEAGPKQAGPWNMPLPTGTGPMAGPMSGPWGARQG